MDLKSLPRAGVVSRPPRFAPRDGDECLVAIDATSNKQVLVTTYGNDRAGAHLRYRDWKIVGQHPTLDPPPFPRPDQVSIKRISRGAAPKD